jgi:biopolymer transport protein ExbD
MKLNKLRIERSPQIMIIPMIDIILFLLVFFMMTTLYMREQDTIPVVLPQSSTAQPTQASLLAVTVTAQGHIIFDNDEISPGLLAARIQTELVRAPATVFIVRGDRRAEYGKVIQILDALKKAGVRKITVATESSASKQ